MVDQLARTGSRFKGTGVVHTDGEVFERGISFYEARGTIRAREPTAVGSRRDGRPHAPLADEVRG